MTKTSPLPGGRRMYLGENTMRITIKRSYASDGIDALEILGFEELCGLAGITADEDSPAGYFINSLFDSYILMVNSIMERNPEAVSHKNPEKYPEFEIYDSVHAILEDDEAEFIVSSAGIEDDARETVKKISAVFFAELNEIFCANSGWDPMQLRKAPDIIVPLDSLEGMPKMPTTLEEVEEFTKVTSRRRSYSHG